VDFNDVCYDEHSDLLYKLAGQVVVHLGSYLSSEDEVVNVLQYHQQALVNLIYSQMQRHFVEQATEYEGTVTRTFRVLHPSTCTIGSQEGVRDFRMPVPEGDRSRIGSMIFGGFTKCLYANQKFDSDSERRFAVILESDDQVLKWFRPTKADLNIYHQKDEAYEPDFVVETQTDKLLCEVKRADEVDDEQSTSKAKAAAKWCEYASAHARSNNGKPWRYILVPHDAITENKTLAGLAAAHEFRLGH